MNEKDLEMYRAGYSEGFDDGFKKGKIEVLNELMKAVMEMKGSTESISCHTVMQILQTRKDGVERY